MTHVGGPKHRSWPGALAAASLTLLAVSATQAQVITTAPLAESFKLRGDLKGVHPRLHFTAADIPAIRARGQGGAKFFVDRMKASFGAYKGKPVTVTGKGDWKNYLFGLWGQLAANMLWIVEQDQAWADTAKSWALHYAGDTSWYASAAELDDLIPQEIVVGMALTYDIQYERLTPAERQLIRDRLKAIVDSQYQRFFIGQYWTNDFQNNHMHNRVGGLGHAAVAILGDDPAVDVQKHADLAHYAYQQIRDWMPDDGSTHEGPGYWNYGYHWVTRLEQLFEHVTGEIPPDTGHDRNAPYYRVYLTTPGMESTFGIGDTGKNAKPQNLEAMLPSIARFGDQRLHGFIRDQMQRNPDGFFQQLGWGLLWYDPSVGEQPHDTLPLGRVFDDLDLISVRTGWEKNDLGLVFIAGPPGGHLMQQKKADGETGYINVAHDHPDQNHFLLWGLGKHLAEDDGYPKSPNTKLTASHNTLLIDGKGGPEEGSGWYQPFPYAQTAFMQDALIDGSTAYAAGNASSLYLNGKRFIRHLAMVEGQLVMIIDDVAGAGTSSHTFDWRLHKAGDWTKHGGDAFTVSDGATGLHVRFVDPPAADLTSSFFSAAGTASPGLSVKTSASETRFLTVLVPQLNGSLAVSASKVAATGGWAIRTSTSGNMDLFAAAEAAGSVQADDVEGSGAAWLVRRDGEVLQLALLARGTSLTIGGSTLLAADSECNLVWRPDPDGGRLAVEPPYKSAGKAMTLQIGGMAASTTFCLALDDAPAGQVITDGEGLATVSLSVMKRRTVTLVQKTAGSTCPAGSDGGVTEGGAADGGSPHGDPADAGLSDGGLTDPADRAESMSSPTLVGDGCSYSAGQRSEPAPLMPALLLFVLFFAFCRLS